MSRIYEFEVRRLNGEGVKLDAYRGRVLLIVNTASRCGFTPQYAGLERLYQKFRARGFEVLGFPCNQFGAQEPGGAEQIAAFCSASYGVTFPLFEKVEVNGARSHPLFEHLKREAPGLLGVRRIKWNFTKFLVGRDGELIRRYAPRTRPEAIEADVEAAL